MAWSVYHGRIGSELELHGWLRSPASGPKRVVTNYREGGSYKTGGGGEVLPLRKGRGGVLAILKFQHTEYFTCNL